MPSEPRWASSQAAREETAFLDQGFREVAVTSGAVDFASDRMRLRIGHDRLSYAISATVARRDGGEGRRTGYSYGELAHHGLLAGERLAGHSRRHAYGPRAEAAWQAKDWPAVVAAGTP